MDKIPPQVTKAVRVFRFDPHPRRKLITIVGETLITVLKNGKTLKEVNEVFAYCHNLMILATYHLSIYLVLLILAT